jgi:hypothetical protein
VSLARDENMYLEGKRARTTRDSHPLPHLVQRTACVPRCPVLPTSELRSSSGWGKVIFRMPPTDASCHAASPTGILRSGHAPLPLQTSQERTIRRVAAVTSPTSHGVYRGGRRSRPSRIKQTPTGWMDGCRLRKRERERETDSAPYTRFPSLQVPSISISMPLPSSCTQDIPSPRPPRRSTYPTLILPRDPDRQLPTGSNDQVTSVPSPKPLYRVK